jgi:hypothetical protein
MVAVGRSKSNHRASLALIVALVGVLVVPAAVALAHQARSVHLLDAAYAIPVAFVLGLCGFAFARGARGRIQWTVGRAGGARRIRVARILALLAVCLAVSAAISVGVYEFLLRLEH